ncbi:LysM peptidoglycan-binding domain-containing protein [Neobacillus sp. LXY-4]|uniref:LysM peptidoglycan-binding domain-containing protein n=1 Tax=Neobacillus sp. LXY-4 TaxID=3379826 RepID=UPI003EDEAFF7
MKRLIGLLFTVLVLYVIYHDLTQGTIPQQEEELAVPASSSIQLPYSVEEVKPGDTVLSIVEKNSTHPLPVSISKVISDFRKLNEGIKPETIQIGHQYKFPTYEEKD